MSFIKTLRLGEEAEFEIRGVIKDVPDNSHIKFSVLIYAETLHHWSEGQSRTEGKFSDHGSQQQSHQIAEVRVSLN